LCLDKAMLVEMKFGFVFGGGGGAHGMGFK
jgi:hypothetical protein